MRRPLYFTLGLVSVALGGAGIFLPLLPTVPFMLLAAFCFGRSDPRVERWLVEHERFGPHIRAWRAERSISRSGKRTAWAAFALSAVIGFLAMSFPWSLAPLAVALVGSSWIASLPTAQDGSGSTGPSA